MCICTDKHNTYFLKVSTEVDANPSFARKQEKNFPTSPFFGSDFQVKHASKTSGVVNQHLAAGKQTRNEDVPGIYIPLLEGDL